MLAETIRDSLKEEFGKQAHNPPGEDPSLGTFYASVVTDLTDRGPLSSIIDKALTARPDMTPKHLVNILFRAVQYVKFEEPNLTYKDYDDPDDWTADLDEIATNSQKSALLQQLLETKHTTTTIYQRYAGAHAAIQLLFGDKPVTVADLGCGGNFGLRGIEFRLPFKPIQDDTPNSLVTKLLQKPINFAKGYAVDQENPDDPEIKKWRRACSFYPKELTGLDAYDKFEQVIANSQKVEFIQADLLDSQAKLTDEKVDAAD